MTTNFELAPGLTWAHGDSQSTLIRMSCTAGIMTGLVKRGEDYEEIPLADLTREIVTAMWAAHPELQERADDDWLIAGLPDDAHRELRRRLGAVIEVTTGLAPGSRNGRPARGAYDPTCTKLGDRIAAKAKELNVSTRTLRRWIKAHERGGAAELIHGNRAIGSPLDLYPPEVVQIAREMAEQQSTRSSLRLNTLVVRLNQGLTDAGHPQLSVYRATKLLHEVSRGMGIRTSAKTRRSKASRPRGARGYVRPTIANEVWEIDSTQLDILAYSPLAPMGVPVYGIFIIDQCTRLLSVYLTLSPPSATSVALALHRRINPLLLDPAMVPVGPAIPASVSTDDDSPLAHPGGVPGEVHADHGREYENDLVLSLFATLGIDLVLARPRTGADKPHIESAIRGINHTLMQFLPGYKGHSPDHRGEHPHKDRLATLEQLRSIADGYCLAHNNHPHTGLVHPAQLGTYLTPMQAYTASVLSGAPTRLNADLNLVFRFLPTKLAVVNGRGPTIDGIVYTSDDIDVMRRLSAGDRIVPGRPLPFHYDPADRSHVYWHEPGTARWHQLYAHGSDRAAIPPLSDEMYERALNVYAHTRPNKQDRSDWAQTIAAFIRDMLESTSTTAGAAALKREFNRYQERLNIFAGTHYPAVAGGRSRRSPRRRAGRALPTVNLDLDSYVEEVYDTDTNEARL